MQKKLIVSIVSVIALAAAQTVSAHAVVSPKQATVATWQEFSLAVPSEKDANTIGIRLLIPDGLSNVRPNVVPGWKISTKTDSSNDVTEIDWTNGSIPSGQREDFQFQIQDPASPTTLDWKVYQTYSDGSVVSWDQDPQGAQGMTESENVGPYSETVITPVTQPTPASSPNFSLNALILATIALIIALFGLVFTDIRTRKK